MNLYGQAKSFFLRNKVSDFEYDCVSNEVRTTNKKILMVCSFGCTVLFFILSILSVFIKDFQFLRHHEIYATTFLLTGIMFLIFYRLPEEKNIYITQLMYVFIVLMSAYTIFNEVFGRRNGFAVLYFVFQFAYPLIFVDKFKRMFSLSLFISVFFCILTFIFKKPQFYKVDIFNAIVFYFLSTLPSFYITKIRIREFTLRQIIETQRDTDELTGLLNKAAFLREAKKNINSTKNGILIILDLDFFKQINDTYGHFTGDNVLKIVSHCIQQTFRATDVMGRFGGDEFVILMAKTVNVGMGMVRCNQLLERLNDTKIFPNDENNKSTIHASIGFALYDNQPDFDTLFKNADDALYQAKNNGKDRACEFKKASGTRRV